MAEKKAHQVAKNSVINSIAFLFNALISFVSVSLVIRFFGVEVQGLIAFGKLLTIGGYFSLFTLGLSFILTRKIATTTGQGHKNESHQWLALISRWAIGMGILLSLILLAGFYLPPNQDMFLKLTGFSIVPVELRDFLLVLLAVSLPLQFFGMIAQASLLGTQDFKTLRVSEVTNSVLLLLFILLFWQRGWAPHQLLLLVVGLEALRALYLIFRLNVAFPIKSWISTSTMHLKPELKAELQVSNASSFLAFLDNTATPYLAMQVLGASGLGLYDALLKLTKILKTFFGLVNSSIMPHAVTAEAKKGQETVTRLFARASFLMAFFVLPMLGVLMGVSDGLLRAWLGREFAVYGQELNLGFLTMLPLIFIGLQGAVFSSRRETLQAQNKVNLFENLFGLPLLYLMSAHFGILGIFLNRLLVAWFGWIPRLYIVVKAYNVSLGQFFRAFRWSAPLSLLTAIFLQTLAFFAFHWAFLFFTGLMLLIVNWFLIYQFSDAEEKQLVHRIATELKILFLRRKAHP